MVWSPSTLCLTVKFFTLTLCENYVLQLYVTTPHQYLIGMLVAGQPRPRSELRHFFLTKSSVKWDYGMQLTYNDRSPDILENTCAGSRNEADDATRDCNCRRFIWNPHTNVGVVSMCRAQIQRPRLVNGGGDLITSLCRPLPRRHCMDNEFFSSRTVGNNDDNMKDDDECDNVFVNALTRMSIIIIL